MEITVTVTAGEILDKGDWDVFCDLKGLNPWCINEGLMESSEKFTLTLEEARQVRLPIKTDRCL
jgi:hypothetical protein